MEQDLELNVWRLAQQACGTAAFVLLVDEAVRSFKREPGFDPTVRLHASWIGSENIRVLRDVLKRHDIYAGQAEGLRRAQVSFENAPETPSAMAPCEKRIGH